MDFHYKDIVPWGRSFDEYLDMFNLSEEDLTRDLVGVGDGPASFNVRMHQRGTPIVSVDPIYRYSAVELRQRIQSIQELLRIGTEVRIFPIVDVNSNPSPFVSPVIDALEKDGIACSIERVPYHFQKTGNEMLRVKSS